MGNKKDYIDFNDPRIKENLKNFNIIEFLNNNNVNYISSGKNIGGDYIGISPCPECGDSKYHFGISIKGGFGTCFKCKYYISAIQLISLYGKMSLKNAFNYIINLNNNIDIDIETRVKAIFNTHKEIQEYKKEEIENLPINIKIDYNLILKIKVLKYFLKKRKLNLWDCKKYDLRYITKGIHKDSILFPIKERDNIVAWQSRKIEYKKYYNSKNLAHYFYNEDNISPNKPLIIVEGFLDYTRINRFINIYYKNKINVTTGLVKSLSKKQLHRLISLKPSLIYIIFDNDSWFDYYKIKNYLPIDVNYVILPKNKDPNDLTWNELKLIFRKEIQWILK